MDKLPSPFWKLDVDLRAHTVAEKLLDKSHSDD